MSAVNKLRRNIEDAISRWEEYIANGRCESYDEYLKWTATLRAYKGFLGDIEDARKEELLEGSDVNELA